MSRGRGEQQYSLTVAAYCGKALPHGCKMRRGKGSPDAREDDGSTPRHSLAWHSQHSCLQTAAQHLRGIEVNSKQARFRQTDRQTDRKFYYCELSVPVKKIQFSWQ
jgi:hypothetical protein